jgi:hypothetical protein
LYTIAKLKCSRSTGAYHHHMLPSLPTSSFMYLQVRDFFSETLGMDGELLDDVVKDVARDDDTLLTFMRKVRVIATMHS